jgi:hypothetical protein
MGMLLTVTNRQALKKRPIFHEEGTHVKGERGKGCGIRGVKKCLKKLMERFKFF